MVLSAAHKLSFDSGDTTGAALAHRGLCAIIQQQLFAGDGSSNGSVIPASFWQQAQAQLEQQEQNQSGQAQLQTEQVNGGVPETSHEPGTNGSSSQYCHESETNGADQAANRPVSNTRNATSEAEEAAMALANMSQAAAQDLQSEVISAAEDLGLSPDSTVPDGGPASYLDFGNEEEASSQEPTAPAPARSQPHTQPAHLQPAVPAPQPMTASIPQPPPSVSPSQLIRTQSFYQILGVSNLSSFEEIHLRFLRIMRRLLRTRYGAESANRDVREFREVLRTICVAHDILKDPNTRTDYDLRQMGARNSQTEESPNDGKLAPRQRLMVGELLECARILEPTELEIALDMHKAEPGTLFGEFLVQAGFLNQEELDSTILAQRLISAGKITVAQFQTAMGKMRAGGTSFFDTLMTEGWLSPSDIFDENSDLWGTPSTHGSNDTPAAVPNRTVKAEPPPWLQHNGEAGNDDNLSMDTCPAAEQSATEQSTAASKGKVQFGQVWNEVDSMAETQSLDVKTLRAVVEVCGDELKDTE